MTHIPQFDPERYAKLLQGIYALCADLHYEVKACQIHASANSHPRIMVELQQQHDTNAVLITHEGVYRQQVPINIDCYSEENIQRVKRFLEMVGPSYLLELISKWEKG